MSREVCEHLIPIEQPCFECDEKGQAAWEQTRGNLRREEQERVFNAARQFKTMGAGIEVITLADLRRAIDSLNR